MKDIENLCNSEAKKYEHRAKIYKLINCFIQSVDGVLVQSISTQCITLTKSGVRLVVVSVASGFGAGLNIFRKFIGEYLKRKEQHNLKKYTLAGTTLQQYCNLHSKC